MTTPTESPGTAIDRALARLRERFGAHVLSTVEHWDVDACAVGVAHPEMRARLVFISTCELPEGRYDAALEIEGEAPPPARIAGADFETLAAFVARHLELAPAHGAGASA